MSMPYGKIVLEDGKTEVLIEIGDTESYRGELGIIDDLKEKFNEIMNIVGETAKSAYDGYLKIPQEARPKELELSFGIKLNSEAGLVFSKIGGEGSFEVTMTWTK
jgi:hypothetical protein